MLEYRCSRSIALTEVELWRNGQIPFQRQPAAEIANVFVNTENFLYHDHDGQRAVRRFWPCVVSRHVLSLRGNRGLTRGNCRFWRRHDG